MEEYIKILKKAIKVLTGKDTGIKLDFEATAQAIENILNRLEQDERVIKEMAKQIHISQHCKFLTGGRKPIPYLEKEIIDHFRKKCE